MCVSVVSVCHGWCVVNMQANQLQEQSKIEFTCSLVLYCLITT